MSASLTTFDNRVTRSASPTWWLVFTREFHDLWIGGKALTLLLLFTVLLGLQSYVFAANSELSLMPPKEMAYLTVQAAIMVGVFISLIIGADSLSGERERATLEALLLTPTSRRQIVIGKFLAGISPWPAAFLVTIPYVFALSQGDEVFRVAVMCSLGLGTLLATAFTAFGMLVSLWSNSNKTSMFASLTAFVLCAMPTQLPGSAQTGTFGRLFKRVNPMESTDHFLEKILVNNRTFAEFNNWLISPVVFAVVVFILLFWYSSPRLRLEGGRLSTIRWPWAKAAVFMAALAASSILAFPALAQSEGTPAASSSPYEISVDASSHVVKNGDKVLFSTTVTNHGTEASPLIIVAMNIIKLSGEGDPVDPEDWSPQRTQAIESLGPGESVAHQWRVNTILDGDYMVYMVAVPKPGGPDATSIPVASSGIHITVTPFARVNPGGVLPYILVTPLILIAGTFLLLRRRRKAVDDGS